ncbi:MAG: hypothetical protein IE927_00175 [Rhodobacterales bacterium]|nr:hypothetical protein [Rhodobacterales bacterium]
MTPTVAAFAHVPGQAMDLYLPPGAVQGSVLYLHGGGFRRGGREGGTAARLAPPLLRQGWALAVADYRLATPLEAFDPDRHAAIRRMAARGAAAAGVSPLLCGAAFLAAVQDAGAAVAALRTGAAAPATAGRPVLALGHSAGGIAALSLVFPPEGWAPLSRPDAVLATAAAMVQPWRIAPGQPPCVMLHGPADRIIGPRAPTVAAARAQATGAALRVIDTGLRGHDTQLAALLDGRLWPHLQGLLDALRDGA